MGVDVSQHRTRSAMATEAPACELCSRDEVLLTARVRDAGGTIHFVRLHCSEEVERRLSNPSRREFQKLQSVDLFRSLRDSGAFEVPAPPVDLVLDTLEIGPGETAQKIVERFKLRK